jgi:hypothetical protein
VAGRITSDQDVTWSTEYGSLGGNGMAHDPDVQDAIDRIVAATTAGERIDAADLELVAEDLQNSGAGSEIGLGMPRSMLPTWPDRDWADGGPFYELYATLEANDEEARIEALESGREQPTDDELLLVARAFVTDALGGEDGYSERLQEVHEHCLLARDGGEAWLDLRTSGYSFSGLDVEIDGPYATRAELEASRGDEGFLGPEDVTVADVQAMRFRS